MEASRSGNTTSKEAAAYYSVFPRPPKFSNRYMYSEEKWGKQERVCRSHVNSNITQLFSDDCRTAGRSVGHCVLDAKAVKTMESAAGWQRHHVSYAEQFIGNAHVNIKSAIDVLKDVESVPKNVLHKLSMAQSSIAQTMALT